MESGELRLLVPREKRSGAKKMAEAGTWGLALARAEVTRGWGTAVVRNGVVVDRESGRGLRPALELVRRSTGAAPCAFADKVLGLAAFRLGCVMGAKAMWGEIASSMAVSEGARREIKVRYHILVPAIMNATRTDLCLMEHLAYLIADDLLFVRQVDSMIR